MHIYRKSINNKLKLDDAQSCTYCSRNSATGIMQNNENNNGMVERSKDSIAFESGYSNVNGLKMYYEKYGAGQPLVLIHGGGSTIETSFGRIIPELSKHRLVIAVELQSHGHTPDIDRPESFEQDADDVAQLLKNLKIEKADFLGFSNGGNTTMKIAMRHPGLARKIIVASSFYKRDGMIAGFWESMQYAILENMPQQLKDAYKKVAPDSGNLIKMFSKDLQRMLEFKDWKENDIRSIAAPAFIICGDKDVVRAEHALEMYRLLPNAQIAILPGGHGEYMGEITTVKSNQSQTFPVVSMIEEFLNK